MKYIFLLILLVVAGCHSVPVRQVTSSVPAKADLQKVETAITKGAADRGWVPKKMAPNLVELTLDTRGHHLVVDVKYDTASYLITYKDSANMDYNPVKYTIHSKYEKWTSLLRQSIDKYLRN
jgi:hypothetical protein